MTFLNAWAAGFAALGPVIVLLYLLKLKRRSLPVSTLIFWQRVLQESRRRALFQKLRHFLSLLLHLLIFALILGALLRPVLDRSVREGGSTVLIVDTRARMQAVEADGSARFAKAKALAAGLIRQTSGERQMAVISANATPAVVAPFTDDEKALSQTLHGLTPTDAGGDIDSAIRLADELLASRKGERRIMVITDHLSEAQLKGRQSHVTCLSCGGARDNIAITRFASRPLLNSPQTSEILLEIANFSGTAAKGNVELSMDGQMLEIKPFALAAGERKIEIFPTVPRLSGNSRGWLSARLDTPDALAADNVAYVAFPLQQPKRVLLVTKGNWFLEKLLAADQDIAFELLEPEAFTIPMAERFDAVVLDHFLPAGFDTLSGKGNFFFIKETPFADGNAALDQPLISDTDARHPVMRLVNLQNITMIRAASIALPKTEGWSWQAPIRSFDHPLMIAGERRGNGLRRIAALAIDVTDSDLPLRVAFPLLMSNTLHWLAGEQAAAIPGARAGETVELAPDESVLTEPEVPGQQSAKQAGPGTAREFFQPLRNGFYHIERPEGTRWVAVNTFDAAESDLRAPDADAATGRALPMQSFVNLAGWPIWQYLAMAAFALFAAEWWLFHRRRTE